MVGKAEDIHRRGNNKDKVCNDERRRVSGAKKGKQRMRSLWERERGLGEEIGWASRHRARCYILVIQCLSGIPNSREGID